MLLQGCTETVDTSHTKVFTFPNRLRELELHRTEVPAMLGPFFSLSAYRHQGHGFGVILKVRGR